MNRTNQNAARICLLDTSIDNLTASEAAAAVDQLVQTDGFHYVISVNTDDLVKIHDNADLREICNDADLVLTDGQILVKISRWMKKPIKERIAMTDFVWDVLELAREKNYKIFLLGGREDALAAAVQTISRKCPGVTVAGTCSPPVGFEKDDVLLEEINGQIRQSGADILLVFLGCPKQNRFIYANKDKYQVPVSITMGGCVDFLAGSVKRAPKWMQEAGLEWFYRFLQEPGRLFKRYFIDDVRIFRLIWKDEIKRSGQK
ncbi:MAG: WecB/TagA/CpsF family glycosyltransferase [Clostridium sp.]|nr:WecB/TagA/CpsF family glycosyltransferase [Ruminococcus flavefaciens]MCM1499462.1 WecB/TagA/CpsF family glycosyltransferase [Clostridium sp.]